MKLWSYGDSHAAGHELGVLENLGKDWLHKTFNVESRDQYIKTYGQKAYKTILYPLISSTVYNDGKHMNPSLSYAGQLANKLGCDLISRAIPGGSNDLSVSKFFDDLVRIQNDDVVLFSLTSVHRFFSENGDTSKLSEHEYMIEHGPSEETWRLWAQGLIALVNNHPYNRGRIIFVNTANHILDVNSISITEKMNNVVSLPFIEFTNDYGSNTRYPLGHIAEHIHSDYADFIYQEHFK
jgi:hypothetical protein